MHFLHQTGPEALIYKNALLLILDFFSSKKIFAEFENRLYFCASVSQRLVRGPFMFGKH
jgi:hypothetical protein